MGKVQVYYNEHEPFAAEWLRRLIGAGLIAPGHVDERDIQDVRAEDLRGFRQCHFFAGLGTWSHALRRAGWSDDRPVWTGSCPCQPFSCAGKQGGSKDERHLWPEWFRLIRECVPAVVFGEQVASKSALAWFDTVSDDLKGEGYAVGAADLCAASVGAPHIRQRLYWMAHTTPGGQRIDGITSRPAGHPPQCESVVGMDDRIGEGLERREEQPAWEECSPVERSGDVVGMADPRLSECEAGGGVAYPDPGEDRERQDDSCRDELASCGADGGRLSHTTTGGQRIDGSAPGDARHTPQREPDNSDGGLANSECVSEHRNSGTIHSSEVSDAECRDDNGSIGGLQAVGPLGGFWSDAVWILCTDGKARPVEPGSFPLAHGAPSRVGRIRAYGNALCSPQAEGFIVAARQILDDGMSSDE